MNAIEINFTKGEYVTALYVKIDAINRLSSEEKKKLKMWLKEKRIPYYWATEKYLEYEPGLYIFNEENNNFKLPYFSEVDTIELQPLSYPIRFLLKALIDRKLQEKLRDRIERIGEDMQGNIVYKSKNPLFLWPSDGVIIYEFYRRLSYRVEHVRHAIEHKLTGEPVYADKLYLLPAIKLQIDTKASLGEIAKYTGYRDLFSLLLYKRVSVEMETRRSIGLLVDIDIKRRLAIVQLAEREVELSLDNVYLQTNPTWYRNFLKEVGQYFRACYDNLINELGLMTYRFEPVAGGSKRRRKIYDAPARYLKDLREEIKETIAKVFPIKFQEVEYQLFKDFVEIERGD